MTRAQASPADDPDGPIRSILIVGGGTAGWVAAAILARALTGTATRITLVESAEIGVIGVGEATIPPFVDLLQFLGIKLPDFIHHTGATLKLGIRFDGWNGPDTSYWHPFGTFGTPVARRPFHHAVLQARAAGATAGVADFNLCAALATRDLAFSPTAPTPGGARFALHLDAVLVARYLAQYAQSLGVTRIEGTVTGATRDARGLIGAVQLADARRVEADLFIDASGFQGVLIDRELAEPYIDWRAHLPCDRALALPTPRGSRLPPYTLSAAMAAGWRWQIALQHRTGNGYVYASSHQTDAAAADELADVLGTAVQAPRLLRFTPGRRARAWVGNCVSIGLASGFLEPLESTSIHLACAGVFNLLDHFPDRACDPALAASYNTELANELEHVRDFLILHYALTQRRDTPFWSDMANAPLPDSLARRIALYAESGIVRPGPRDLFTEPSWFYVYDGMGLVPRRTDPLLGVVDPARLAQMLGQIGRDALAGAAAAMPHAQLFPPSPTRVAMSA
jgi:tryptophan halogenase